MEFIVYALFIYAELAHGCVDQIIAVRAVTE
jgi:hypothetical protein